MIVVLSAVTLALLAAFALWREFRKGRESGCPSCPVRHPRRRAHE